MNILLFLTPKEDVTYIHDTYTLGRTLERMEEHKYSCIPIINDRGKYVGTLTEGDMLWGLRNRGALNLKAAEDMTIMSFNRRADYASIRVDSAMEDLMDKAMRQNFVPVVDDQKNFIGIVTRRDIMQYICSSCGKESKEK